MDTSNYFRSIILGLHVLKLAMLPMLSWMVQTVSCSLAKLPRARTRFSQVCIVSVNLSIVMALMVLSSFNDG